MEKITPLSDDSRKRIFDLIGNEILECGKEVDYIYTLHKDLADRNKELSGMLALHLHVLFILLDLNTAFRVYLSAKLSYEERYALRQMNVIMVEGFKRIYGFGNAIKKSLLYNVRPEINSITATDRYGYDVIIENLVNLGESENLDKGSRDLSIHYDADVNKVYEMIIGITDAEVIVRKVNSCLKVFKGLTAYINKVDNPYIQSLLGSNTY